MNATNAIRIVDATTARAYLTANGHEFSDDTTAADRVIVLQVCRRCGGSGRYSYNPTDADRCFECVCAGKPPRWNASLDVVAPGIAEALLATGREQSVAWAEHPAALPCPEAAAPMQEFAASPSPGQRRFRSADMSPAAA